MLCCRASLEADKRKLNERIAKLQEQLVLQEKVSQDLSRVAANASQLQNVVSILGVIPQLIIVAGCSIDLAQLLGILSDSRTYYLKHVRQGAVLVYQQLLTS